MKRLAVACLAAIVACGAAWSLADAQQTNNGHHYGWRNRDRGRYSNQCYSGQYGGRHYDRRSNGDNDNDDDNDRDDNRQGQYGQGQYGQYGQNGQNGNCGGQYGQGNSVVRGQIVGVNGNQVTIRQNASYNGGYGNTGGYGNYGGYGQTITIDDQPALDNRTSGRVSVGRYVTAYGYWQNGVFYATQMN